MLQKRVLDGVFQRGLLQGFWRILKMYTYRILR